MSPSLWVERSKGSLCDGRLSAPLRYQVTSSTNVHFASQPPSRLSLPPSLTSFCYWNWIFLTIPGCPWTCYVAQVCHWISSLLPQPPVCSHSSFWGIKSLKKHRPLWAGPTGPSCIEAHLASTETYWHRSHRISWNKWSNRALPSLSRH